MHKVLVHKMGDHVGVAVDDIRSGEDVEGIFMDSGQALRVTSRDAVPLGHKIALIDVIEGAKVVEYGATIGLARKKVNKGDHVHVHNIRSARW